MTAELVVRIWEDVKPLRVRVVSRDSRGRYVGAISFCADSFEPKIKGRTMAQWMECFARDEQFIRDLVAQRGFYRAEWLAKTQRQKEMRKKPVASVSPEAAKVEKMLRLASIARSA